MPMALAQKYARLSEKASLFNHASMASNNHFFFKCLSPRNTKPSSTFHADIEESFSSYDTLRTEMLETADAMFGPGFVWIVKDANYGMMKLLCTYLAGSPHKGAHFRSQSVDMATHTTGVTGAARFKAMQPANRVGHAGPYAHNAGQDEGAPGNYNSDPILCVNTWEHAYLRDYGVGGKRAYLERWWDRIDWVAVENTAKQLGAENNAKPVDRQRNANRQIGGRIAGSMSRNYASGVY
jgi:superoxide dismutase, Fe-Mn family